MTNRTIGTLAWLLTFGMLFAALIGFAGWADQYDLTQQAKRDCAAVSSSRIGFVNLNTVYSECTAAGQISWPGEKEMRTIFACRIGEK